MSRQNNHHRRAGAQHKGRGATAVEYALMVILIVVGLVVIFKRLVYRSHQEAGKAGMYITSSISGMGNGGT